MKLFTKYGRINLLVTVLIFIISGIAYYFTLRIVLIHQIDQDLGIEEAEIVAYVQLHNRLPESISVQDQVIQFNSSYAPVKRKFTTIELIDPGEKNKESFRQLSFGIGVKDEDYKVEVSKSLEQTDRLIRSILIVTLVTILLILVAYFIINRVLLKKIWKPFYQSLEAVKQFKISRTQAFTLPSTNTDEFEFMNQILEKITSQASHDYLALKTFSENASHEIQTPIAIIRSKLDLVIQDENLTEKQSHILQAAYHSIEKLSRLNQSLLLLAKIENKQFEEVDVVDIKKILEEKLDEFQELWEAQQIRTVSTLSPVLVKMNNELADILMNNLLSNATKYNCKGGSIYIELKDTGLTISNTSKEPALAEEHLYKRFFKSATNSNHNGLGLSIVKQIGDASGFGVRYEFKDGLHEFRIEW